MIEMPIGTYEGSPYPGMSPPHPRLTHWVCWDGGFWAWAWPPLDSGHMVLVAGPGEDAFVLEEGERWEVGVLNLETLEPTVEFEVWPAELPQVMEDLAEEVKVRELAKKTRELAHRRALGSMDPIWDCVSRLETYPDTGGMPIESLIEEAEGWLNKDRK